MANLAAITGISFEFGHHHLSPLEIWIKPSINKVCYESFDTTPVVEASYIMDSTACIEFNPKYY